MFRYRRGKLTPLMTFSLLLFGVGGGYYIWKPLLVEHLDRISRQPEGQKEKSIEK